MRNGINTRRSAKLHAPNSKLPDPSTKLPGRSRSSIRFAHEKTIQLSARREIGAYANELEFARFITDVGDLLRLALVFVMRVACGA